MNNEVITITKLEDLNRESCMQNAANAASPAYKMLQMPQAIVTVLFGCNNQICCSFTVRKCEALEYCKVTAHFIITTKEHCNYRVSGNTFLVST